MSKNKWTIITARACVTRNGGKVGTKKIRMRNPGIRVLSAIDYLCNHLGYRWYTS